jgi:mannose-6-phosphate isomerase-like protein (cupin superfamily)
MNIQDRFPLTRRGLLTGGAASLAGVSLVLIAAEGEAQEPNATPAERSSARGFRVAAGDDRVKEHRRLFGDRPIPLDIKVSTADSGGGMLVVEHTDTKKSGPPRHIHHDQDEWFYVVKGDYIVEVAGERFTLGPGDSVMGPRKIPHAWAFVGEGTGKLIITFQPAGKMEAFFNKIAPMTEFPPREEMERMFREHGLQLTGPPLLGG